MKSILQALILSIISFTAIDGYAQCNSTINSFPYAESFESSSPSWTPTTNSTSCTQIWARDAGGTGSSGTGPSSASNGVFYLYTEASFGCSNKTLIVESPCFNLTGHTSASFSFDYHMNGTSMGILILEISTNNGSTWSSLWNKAGSQGNSWKSQTITLSGNNANKVIKLRFKGVTGSSWSSDIAVDNVNLQTSGGGSGTCTPLVNTFPHCESFESSNSSWTPITSSTSCTGTWARDAGGTGSSGTGPSSAIDGDFYIYTEASSGCSNRTMRIVSPCYDLTGITETDFTFDYHMLGSNIGSLRLEISLNDGATWSQLWIKIGSQGALWTAERITLSGNNANRVIKLRFTGITGNGFRSDIAVDNLKLRGGTSCTLNDLSSIGSAVHSAISPTSILEESTCMSSDIFTCNNRLDQVLLDGPAIFSGVENMLATAEHEVLMSFLAWDSNCEATQKIGNGLRLSESNHSASDPLLVKIIIDDNIFATNGQWQNVLADINNNWNLNMNLFKFEVFRFDNDLGNLHDKFIIVDRQKLFITGANPQVKHDSDFQGSSNCTNLLPGLNFVGPWRDYGFILTGEVAKSAFCTFNFTLITEAQNNVTKLVQILGNQTGQSSSPEFVCSPVGTLPILAATRRRNNYPFSNANDNGQDRAWMTLMDEAQSHIDICTPNINDDQFKQRLVAAVGRGVKVNLVLGRQFNDGSTGTNAPFQGGFNMEVVDDLRNDIKNNHPNFINGLEIRWHSLDSEIQVLQNGGRALHGKYMSVDDEIVMIGSGNQDTQSWNFSQEFNLVIDDPATTQQIKSQTFTPTWNTGNRAYIELYKSNNAQGDLVSIQSTLHNVQLNYPQIEGCDADKYVENNDDARSAVIYNTPACRKITLFDNSNGSTNDDFVVITTRQFITRLEINTYEQSFENAFVRVDYCCGGNLDGKVSAIKVENGCGGGNPGEGTVSKPQTILNQTMTLYPNPVVDNAQIGVAFNLPEDMAIELRVFSSLGKLVYQESLDLQAGKNLRSLQANVLNVPGVYTVIATSNGKVLSTSKLAKF